MLLQKPQNCHLHNVRVEVKAVLETLGQVLKVPVVADLGHGDDALDTDGVSIHRVDDRAQVGAVSALNLKLNTKQTNLSISPHQSFICAYSCRY